MAFKDILVHIDNAHHCEAMLDLAIGLAREQQAHLTGLFVNSRPHYRPEHGHAGFKAADLQTIFRRKTEQAGIVSEWLTVDWTVTGVSMTEIVNLHAYTKDLVILGQIDDGSCGGEIPSDLPEGVVLGSGRPVLVVPFAGTFATLGDRVMVAWKPGRESARAINDAGEFLLNARQVGLLAVTPPGVGESADRLSFADICKHLARLGVKTKVDEVVGADIPIGDVLLNQAWEEGCDLLVMGAYTHTPRGVALSPVATHVLKHMTMPVLMSH